MPVQLVLQFWEGLLDFFILYAWFFQIVCRAYKHKSGLCNFGNHSETLLLPFCCCCDLIIINYSAYCCIHCKFFVHGFCLNMSKEITIILFKNYTLFLNTLVNNESKTCNVCDELIEGISLRCNNATDCEFYYHVACWYPYTRSLKHKPHWWSWFGLFNEEQCTVLSVSNMASATITVKIHSIGAVSVIGMFVLNLFLCRLL